MVFQPKLFTAPDIQIGRDAQNINQQLFENDIKVASTKKSLLANSLEGLQNGLSLAQSINTIKQQEVNLQNSQIEQKKAAIAANAKAVEQQQDLKFIASLESEDPQAQMEALASAPPQVKQRNQDIAMIAARGLESNPSLPPAMRQAVSEQIIPTLDPSIAKQRDEQAARNQAAQTARDQSPSGGQNKPLTAAERKQLTEFVPPAQHAQVIAEEEARRRGQSQTKPGRVAASPQLNTQRAIPADAGNVPGDQGVPAQAPLARPNTGGGEAPAPQPQQQSAAEITEGVAKQGAPRAGQILFGESESGPDLNQVVNEQVDAQINKRFDSLIPTLGNTKVSERKQKFFEENEKKKREQFKETRDVRDRATRAGENIITKVEGAIEADIELNGQDSLLGGGVGGSLSRLTNLSAEQSDKILKPLQAAADEIKLLMLAESGAGTKIADSDKEAEAFRRMRFDPSLGREAIMSNLALIKKAQKKIRERSEFDNLLGQTNLTAEQIDQLYQQYDKEHPVAAEVDGTGEGEDNPLKIKMEADRPTANEWLNHVFTGSALPEKGTSFPGRDNPTGAPLQPTPAAPDIQNSASPPVNPDKAQEQGPNETVPAPLENDIQETEQGIVPSQKGSEFFDADSDVVRVALSTDNGRINKVTPQLLAGLVSQESAGDETATSSKGAFGLTQLMPATGREVLEKMGGNPNDYDKIVKDPQAQLAMGTFYLNEQLDRYDGNLDLALAAYNAGPGRVDSWVKQYGDDWTVIKKNLEAKGQFAETTDYVGKVKSKALKHAGEETAEAPAASPTPEPTPDGSPSPTPSPTPAPEITEGKPEDKPVFFRDQNGSLKIDRDSTLGKGIATLATAGNAFLFGFGDDIVGAFGGDKEKIRGELDAFEESNPVTSGIAKGVGMVGSAVVTGGVGAAGVKGVAASGSGLIARTAAGATATGARGVATRAGLTAVGGAVEAALQGAGDNDGTSKQRLNAALRDAPLGALFGAGGSVVGDGIAKVGRGVLAKLMGKAGDDLAEGLTPAERQAQELIFERLQGVSREERIAAIKLMRDNGDLPENMVTALGKNNAIDELADNIARQPSTSKVVTDTVDAGLTSSATRITNKVQEVFNGDNAEEAGTQLLEAFQGVQKNLKAARKQAADPIYAEAFEQGAKESEGLKAVMQMKEVQSAIKKVKGSLPGLTDDISGAPQLIVDANGQPFKSALRGKGDTSPEVLDKAISALQARVSEGGEAGFFARDALNALKEEVFALHPKLEQARAVFKEGSEGLNKFTQTQAKIMDKISKSGTVENLNKEVFNKLNPREISELKGLLGPKHAAKFEQMGANFIDDALAATVDGKTKGFVDKFLGTPAKQDKFRAIVGEKKYRAMRGVFQDEKRILRQVDVFAQNSKTQMRQETEKALNNKINPILSRLGETFQRKGANILDAMGNSLGQTSDSAKAEVATALSEFLITNPNAGADVLEKSLSYISVVEGREAAGKLMQKIFSTTSRAQGRDVEATVPDLTDTPSLVSKGARFIAN